MTINHGIILGHLADRGQDYDWHSFASKSPPKTDGQNSGKEYILRNVYIAQKIYNNHSMKFLDDHHQHNPASSIFHLLLKLSWAGVLTEGGGGKWQA